MITKRYLYDIHVFNANNLDADLYNADLDFISSLKHLAMRENE